MKQPTSKIRLLIITHDASRTGAPTVIKNLAELLHDNQEIHFEILIKHRPGRALYKDFKRLAKTTFLVEWLKRFNFPVFKNFLLFKLNRLKNLKNYIASFDVVISNTITNGDIHEILKDHPNVITYVHELEESIYRCTSSHDLKKVMSHSRAFLYPSGEVKNNLIINHAVDEKKLFHMPAYIPDRYSVYRNFRLPFRTAHNIKDTEFLILGIGTNHWTKGPDIFIQTIMLAKQHGLPVRGIWVGSNKKSIEHRRLLYDIRKMNLSDTVSILEPSDDVMKFLSAADLFFLSSREDSYPLVMIEAAMMSLPIMYFQGSGGASEFVESDAGIALEYGRVDVAVKKIENLINNKELYQQYISTAREKYLKLHSKESVPNYLNSILTENDISQVK